ncbi:MAG: AAA family ATPase [Candidatus Hydrogenedentes bacterium]|nr:AAA family ATPase [Candidatus Hydrogenedentota bacterium]
MKTIDDTIDFTKYLDIPVEAAKVKPASAWVDGVVRRLSHTQQASDATLPWAKVRTKFQLRPGELTVWAGPNGSGKSLVLNQVIHNLNRQGERACIASMEMKPEATMARMTRQAAGARNPTEEYVRAFHEWTDDRLWIFDHHGTVKRDVILGVMNYVAEEIGVNHFVIDSLMKCGIGAVGDAAMNDQKNFVDALCAWAKDHTAHVHLVCHSRKGESSRAKMDRYDVKGAGEITDQADNVVLVWRNKDKEEDSHKPEAERDPKYREQPDSLLTVDKQRHGEWEGKIALWYDADSMQYVETSETPPRYLELAQ